MTKYTIIEVGKFVQRWIIVYYLMYMAIGKDCKLCVLTIIFYKNIQISPKKRLHFWITYVIMDILVGMNCLSCTYLLCEFVQFRQERFLALVDKLWNSDKIVVHAIK